MTLFYFCALGLCFIISQHAFTKLYLLPIVRIINYIPKKYFKPIRLYQINQLDSIYLKNTDSNGPLYTHAIIEKIGSSSGIGNSLSKGAIKAGLF